MKNLTGYFYFAKLSNRTFGNGTIEKVNLHGKYLKKYKTNSLTYLTSTALFFEKYDKSASRDRKTFWAPDTCKKDVPIENLKHDKMLDPLDKGARIFRHFTIRNVTISSTLFA